MTPNQVIKFFGSEAEAARKLGVTRQCINYWMHRNLPSGKRIPMRTQAYIQIATDGLLKAKRNGATKAAA